MTCREALTLVPLLLDGEIESGQERALVMHRAHCAPCDAECRELQRLQGTVHQSVRARAEAVDLSTFWPRIEQRLRTPERSTAELSWWRRLQAWWDAGERRWMVPAPAFAAIAIIAVLSILVLRMRSPQTAMNQPPPELAAADLTAMTLESLDPVSSPLIAEQIREPLRDEP